MGNKILFFVILLLTIHGYSTAQTDVIQLKDSTVVKGKIIYNKPLTYVKIKKTDGQVVLYKYSVIESITEGVMDEISNSGEKFLIAKPFNKSTYQGVELRKMKHVQLDEIMFLDKQSHAQFKKANSIGNIGSLLMIAGVVGSIVWQNQAIAGESSNAAVTSAIALGCSVGGLSLSIAGASGKKKAIRNFNNHP